MCGGVEVGGDVLAKAKNSELFGKVEEGRLTMRKKGSSRQVFCLDKMISKGIKR